MKSKQSFATGLNYYKIAGIFLFGSLLGVIYEDIFILITEGFLMSHRGVMFLPLNPLYGVGFVIIILVLSRLKKWYQIILIGAIMIGSLEYGASLGLEFISGNRAWDYSNLITNIDGRTTIIISLFWGLCSAILIKVVYPRLSSWIESLPPKRAKIIINILIGLVVLDMLIGYPALARQGFRAKGVEPFTIFGVWYDYLLSDERLAMFFPAMAKEHIDISKYKIYIGVDEMIFLLDLGLIAVSIYTTVLLLKKYINSKKDIKIEAFDNKTNKYGIIIPARDESNIITNLIENILSQKYPIDPSDIYIIVESVDDPTVLIAQKYNINIFYRVNLNNRGKGYALDECFKYLLENNIKHDGYFIFDADNRISDNFIYRMNQVFNEGYDVAVGYRFPSNGNENLITACSGLTFTMINSIGNKNKMINKEPIIVSGTGFFIRGNRIEQLSGFPFYSLTEDYEFSLYFNHANYKSAYVEDAIFYDEQPLTASQSNSQRARWIKGYFSARKKFKSTIGNERKVLNSSFHITPYIILISFATIYFLSSISLAICNYCDNRWQFIIRIGVVSILIYTFLLFFTFYLIKCTKKGEIEKPMIKKLLILHPFFLASYLLIIIKIIFTKEEITWEKIVHLGR